jgi:glycosyltransferase involved in cell wall biosynthesis
MLNSIDYFHFNSSIAKQVYDKHVSVSGEIISISHNDIKDNRKIREYKVDTPLRITYLGPTEKYKGFNMLLESLNSLIENSCNDWKLNVYGNSNDLITSNENIIFHGRHVQ